MKKQLFLVLLCYVALGAKAQTPIAHYPFSGNANDAVGSNNGTVNGATLATDRFGNANSAYSFDGVDDNISIVHNAIFNFSSYTVSMWFKYNGTGTAGKSYWTLISKNNNGDGFQDAIHLWVTENNKFSGGRIGGGGSYEVTFGASPAINDGNWHQTTVVCDNANDVIRQYLDGVLISTSPFTGNPFNNSANIKIGFWEAYNNFFNGSIDEVKLYNTALTGAQVQQAYLASTGVVAYYPFTGNANDAIGTNNGTVNGATLTTDRFGNANSAYSFDGVDDNISCNFTSNLTTAFTTSYWFKMPALPAANTVYEILSKRSLCASSHTDFPFGLSVNSSGIVTALFSKGDDFVAENTLQSDPLSVNQWYFITVAYSANNSVQLYINGVEVASAVINYSVSSNSQNWTIGRASQENLPGCPLTNTHTNGIIDEVKIYNTALTGAQVLAEFNANAPTPNYASQFGNSVLMNGSTDNIDLGTSFTQQVFTVEMWLKPGATQVQYADIIDNNHSGSFTNWVCQQDNNNVNSYGFGTMNTGVFFTLQANVWQHLTLVKSATTLEAYVNGILIQSVPYVGGPINYSGNFLRLGRWGGGGRNWNGSMDEVRFWNVARTQAEIQANMNTQLTGSESGLVGYWDMNRSGQGAGLTVDNEATLTGATLNGTTVGTASTPIFTPGVIMPTPQQASGSGNAISFDGVDDHLEIPNASNLNFGISQDFAVETWIKIPVNQNFTTSSDNIIIDKWGGFGSGNAYPFSIRYQNPGSPIANKINVVRSSDIGGSSEITSVKDMNDNQWHHVVFVKNGTVLSLYIDGILNGTATDVSSGNTLNNANVTLGRRNGATGQAFFTGSIDEVRIWNTALTQAQIRDRMCRKITSGDALYANLVAYYNFDESTGTTAFDGSASGNNSTLVNGPTRVTSGAAIGNTSAHNYVATGLPGANLSINAQDNLAVAYTAGTFTGEAGTHIYAVTEAPNTTNGIGGIDTNSRYFGVFNANLTSPEYTATYNYSGNPMAAVANESLLKLYRRNDNAGTTWAATTAVQDLNTNTLTLTGQSTEYILAAETCPNIATSFNATACQSYVWDDSTYTTSGAKVQTLQNVNGCDSVVTLNLTITPPLTWYLDADLDGYYTQVQVACATPGTGWTSTLPVGGFGDCDDTNNTKWQIGQFFVDADGDGYGASATTVPVCYGASTPAGYVVTSLGLDCDDNNILIYQTGQFFVDADGDGYGASANTVPVCYGATSPAGYVVTSLGLDCDDNNILVYQIGQFFEDADGDGYSPSTSTTALCYGLTLPAGKSLTSLGADCNDNNPTINAGAQRLEFSGGTNFASSIIYPQQGTSYTNFQFEVTYFDANGALPPPTYPRVYLDYEGNGVYNNANDRAIIMTPYDAGDLNTADGKRYIGTINTLPNGTNWETSIQVTAGSCLTQIGPFNYPDVLVLPDLQIFANKITFSSQNPAVSSPLTINALITNVSDYAAQNFVVHLLNEYDTTIVYPDIIVSNLAAHSSTTVTWNITTPALPAWCPMRVFVDNTNVIAESNELDNNAVRPFTNGNFVVPGTIVTTGSVVPPVSFSSVGNVLSLTGTAFYSGVAVPMPDTSAAGAEVNFTIVETGANFIGYTDAQGNFNLPFTAPLGAGTYTITGYLTDFTLTGFLPVGISFTILPVCKPDLTAALTLSSYNIIQGQSVTGSVTVTNAGCASSAASVLTMSQSGGSPTLTNINVPSLAPGASFTTSLGSIAFAVPGSFGFCATADGDFAIDEANESNNISCQTILVLPALPEIFVQRGSSPVLFNCTGTLPLYAEVANTGGAATGNFNCQVRVKQGLAIVQTFSVPVSSIASQSATSFSVNFIVPSNGSYTVEIICDNTNVVTEVNENNNTSEFAVDILLCQPDLVVGDCEFVDATSANTSYNSTMDLNATIFNQGNAVATGPIDVKFELSNGTSYTTQILGNLAPGASALATVNVPAFISTSTTLTVIADYTNSIAELQEFNNQSVAKRTSWEFYPVANFYPCGTNFWDVQYLANQAIYLSVAYRAEELYDADTLDIKFEVSGPGIVGTLNLGNAQAYNVEQTCGTCPRVAVLPNNFVFGQVGTYTFTMTVDPNNKYAETNEGNNVMVVTVVVTDLPDMRTLSQFINPSALNPLAGQSVNFTVTYENIGASNITDQMKFKLLVDNVPVDSIYPVLGLVTNDNATYNFSIPWSSNIPGAHIIRAIIDSDDDVLEQTNANNEATRAIVVGDAANLFFDLLTSPTLNPNLGDPMQINAKVKNDGALASTTDVKFYYVDDFLNEVLIDTRSVTVGGNDDTTFSVPWNVLDNKTTIIGRIVNSTALEFNYDDNEASFAIGAMDLFMQANAACDPGNLGSITTIVTGGTPPYNYTWSNGSGSSTLVDVAGTYNLVVTDNTGQSISGSATIVSCPVNCVPVATSFSQIACNSYLWNGTLYTSSGQFEKTLATVLGCDSVVTLNLTVNYTKTGTDLQTACVNYTWLDGNTYTANNNSATYTFANGAANGCDSIVTLDLTITPLAGSTTKATACNSYLWTQNGQTYTASGIYTDSSNCQIDTLDLTITPLGGSTITESACGSFIWSLNNQTYTSSGTYIETGSCGADTLVLTITPITGSATTVSACDSYMWNSIIYTTSGMYFDSVGCNVDTLDLTITPTTGMIYTESVCGNFLWSVNGTTYTQSGTYVETVGCQSDTLVLTITPISGSKLTTAACDVYTWNADGATYTSSGTYYFTDGCHSDTLVLTINQSTSNATTIVASGSYTWAVNGVTYTQSGVYTDTTTNQAGCQHVETLNLTITTGGTNCFASVTIVSPGLNAAWKSYGANNPNMFYYGLANSQRINARVVGGVGPFTYSWSNSGSTDFMFPRTYYPANSIDIMEPTAATIITVVVTDQGTGCQYTTSLFMDWTDDYYCYKIGYTWYIKVCQNGQSLCVPWDIGNSLLRNNQATLGGCQTAKDLSQNAIANTEMEIYPNPNQGVFNVVVTNGFDGSLEIFDLSGKRISIENKQADLGTIDRTYDLRHLPQGMYFVQYTAGEIVLTKKFVIQD